MSLIGSLDPSIRNKKLVAETLELNQVTQAYEAQLDIRPTASNKILWHPYMESNHDLDFRKILFYTLNYKGIKLMVSLVGIEPTYSPVRSGAP